MPSDAPPPSKKIQPFSGCNCYYLLNKMNDSEAMVRRTLEGMREMGFNVIRMWAFDDGNNTNINVHLQCSPGELTAHGKEHLKNLFVMLDDVNNKIHPKEPPMMFMMTLTNYLKDYGGIGQYVRWQLDTHNEIDDATKETFYTSDARDSYDNYVKALIKFCKDTTISNNNNGTMPQKKLIDLVHSWDICNEPRCKVTKKFGAVTEWIQRAAKTIQAADDEVRREGQVTLRVRPITVGLEGFFGPSSPGDHSYNPYNGCESEGVDWEAIGQLDEIDFMSIHLWPDKWITNDPKEAIRWSEAWIKRHMEVCRDLQKPLCLQEYNISVGADAEWARSDDGLKGDKCLATSEDRFKLFEKVRELMKDPGDRNNPNVLIGAMVWMIADDEAHCDRNWDKQGHMIVPVHAVAGRSLWDLGKVAADRRRSPPPASHTVS